MLEVDRKSDMVLSLFKLPVLFFFSMNKDDFTMNLL